MTHRVVVTGLGIVSPLGNEVNEAFNNAIAGKNCVDFVDGFDLEGLKVQFAAQVKDFDASKYLTKREIRRQDLYSQYAVYAAMDAFEDAKLKDQVNPDDMGVIMGTGMGGMQTFAKDLYRAFEGGYGKIPPMFIPMIIPNMASGNVSIALKAQNHTTAVTTACAAGTHAIGDAYRHIKHGYAKVMIAGGTEAGVNPFTLAGFNAISALSTSEDPKTASKPFDKERDGFVLGEGAGVLVLESLEHAQARNAHIYAEVIGYGSTSDAYHITAPSGTGAIKAMEQAIADAKIKKEDVDYVNAHGTSTPLNDKFETEALKAVFQDHAKNLKVSSTKSMHGHALGGTGGIEAVLSIKALEKGIIPPTINYQNEDPDCDLNYVPNQALEADIQVAMSNSLGFGGHNAILLFKKGSD